jgi:LuxR family maltose regulon positive regulatory protein
MPALLVTRANPLLATKLALPPARPSLVSRPRLVERLHQGQDGRLTLVVAPPGSGKTTLISAWLKQIADCRLQIADKATAPVANRQSPIAWLSLDDADNDPTRFWSYGLAAVERLFPGASDHALSMLRSPQPPPLEVIVGALLNELAEHSPDSPSPAVLVLDDYHVIHNQAIHESLAFLLEQMPPGLHIAITSREEPPLPLARLRVRGQLNELRATDLRFTAEESAAFLNGVMGLGLSARDVEALEERTEGWIAALHLAALSLRGRGNVQELIATFTGSHRFLVDYLAEEVLRRQPPEVQTFLLHTALLNRLNGPLCDALVQADDGSGSRPSATLLAELERANLFLVPLDDERNWYRYHHLFGEFLRERLRQRDQALLNRLHQRAATWFESQGLVAEAIGHALAGHAPEHAARLIEAVARPMLLRSEVATVLGWLRALPPATVQTQAELALIWAWALTVAGQVDEVEGHLREAEAALLATPAPQLQGEIVAVRATVAGLRRDIPVAIVLARQALEQLPAENVQIRSVVALMLGTSTYLSGDMAAAAVAFHETVRASQASDNIIIYMFAQRQLGELQMRQGRLQQAARTFQQALDFAAARYPQREGRSRPIPVAGTAYVGMGLLFYEWNRLDEAARYLGDGIELGQQGENVEILLMGPIGLAHTQLALGQVPQAETTMTRAVELARKTGVPRLIDWLHAEQARLWLMQNRVAEAAAWAQSPNNQGFNYSFADEPDYLREIDYMVLAQVALAQGRAADALPLLEKLARSAEAQGRQGSVIEVLALQALALHGAGHGSEALATLERSLSLAEPEGYLRTLVDMGPAMADLLRLARPREARLRQYVARLLAAMPGQEETHQPQVAEVPRRNAATPAPEPLLEPLSEREIEVLQLVAAGLSNQEIADKLIVGLSTVKKHINNAYAKMDVKSRTQAIVRMRELGLLT